MDFITPIYDALQATLSIAWTLFINGGWIILLIAVTYIAFKIYMEKITTAFKNSHEQVFFQIKVEKENLQSLLAMEQIFAHMHAIHSGFTWAETHIEGKVNLWMSMEIVSIG